MPEEMTPKKRQLSSSQIIVLGFAAVVLLGALILSLPISSVDRTWTPFLDAVFTSTSATCVTGLVVLDTGSHWSLFGQAVILLLIQIGGLGIITMAALFTMLSGRQISLRQRSIMMDAISAPQVGGIVRLTRFILKGTLLIEGLGALALMPPMIRAHGARGIWMAFFHSISAFCNAGFDILGTKEAPFASMVSFEESIYVNVVLILLIVIGGIGFLVWEDVVVNHHHFSKYKMQSKVVLVTSAILVVFPAILFYFTDFSQRGGAAGVFDALFQSVTTRTAGFNTVDLAAMSGGARAVMIALMLVGGSPGSTAGGMKTTTLAVLFATAFSTFSQKEDVHFFGRRIGFKPIKNAATILIMYVFLFLSSACAISMLDGIEIGTCLFETASAVGTVGLTLGLTPYLGTVSHMILAFLMFFGRVGGLTLIFAAQSPFNVNPVKLPEEQITVG